MRSRSATSGHSLVSVQPFVRWGEPDGRVEEERFPYKEGWRPYHGVKSRPRIQIILLSIVFADTKILFELLSAAMVTLRNLLLGALHMFGVHTTKRD